MNKKYIYNNIDFDSVAVDDPGPSNGSSLASTTKDSPSSMDYYSPLSSMDDSAPPLDSESDSDTFQSFIDRGRWQSRGGRRIGKRLRGRGRARMAMSRGRRGQRGRRPASRRQSGRSRIQGSGNYSHLSAAAMAVLNEIGSIVWKKEEPHSFTQAYAQVPGPTSADVTRQSTPIQLFCLFFFLMRCGI